MIEILHGDCRERLPALAGDSIQCCITSPPYWGLRDYGHRDQIGNEPEAGQYVEELVRVFREVRRILKPDGTLWLNLGDSYTEKALTGIPWRVALALQADGWFLRADIIWSKPNGMPESVKDRVTRSHEYLFMLTKQERYHYDGEAIRERITSDRAPSRKAKGSGFGKAGMGQNSRSYDGEGEWRNRRSVWTVPVGQYEEAHFATFPPDLIRPCVLASTRAGDLVLDPFAGTGTTGQVAIEYGRGAVMIEISDEYLRLLNDRTNITPGLPL